MLIDGKERLTAKIKKSCHKKLDNKKKIFTMHLHRMTKQAVKPTGQMNMIKVELKQYSQK